MSSSYLAELNVSSPSQRARLDKAADNQLATRVDPADGLCNVIAAICADARMDAVRYAIRSNVGHDGE